MVRRSDRWLIISSASTGPMRGKSGEAYRARLLALLEEARSIVPDERILVVVRDSESPWWAPLLRSLPGGNILREPIDRGSAIGVLLAFLRVFRRDPGADLTIVSFDAEPGAMRAALSSSVPRAHRELPAVWRASPAALLRMFRHAQPSLLSSLLAHVRDEEEDRPPSLDGLYPFLPAVDLGRDVYAIAAQV